MFPHLLSALIFVDPVWLDLGSKGEGDFFADQLLKLGLECLVGFLNQGGVEKPEYLIPGKP
jgi:hypothetical protein